RGDTADGGTLGSVGLRLQVNGDTGTNYDIQDSLLSGPANTWTGGATFNTGNARIGVIPAPGTAAARVTSGSVEFGYYNLVGQPVNRSRNARNYADVAVGQELLDVIYHPAVAVAITSLLVQASVGNLLQGKFRLMAY